jgi:hypothetical protein
MARPGLAQPRRRPDLPAGATCRQGRGTTCRPDLPPPPRVAPRRVDLSPLDFSAKFEEVKFVASRLMGAGCPPGPLCVGVAWGPAGRDLKTKSSCTKTKSPRPAPPSLAAAPTCPPGRRVTSARNDLPPRPPPSPPRVSPRRVYLSPLFFTNCLRRYRQFVLFGAPLIQRPSAL